MIRKIPIALTAITSVIIALLSYRFVFLGFNAQSYPVMMVHLEMTKVALIAHIAASPIALAVGAFQFMHSIRKKRPALHRLMGRVYAVAIIVGGVGALVMAPNANGGVVSVVGFSLLAVLWIAVTLEAVRHAMARRFDLHRIWMIRSFAMTFAAVTLRFELEPLMSLGGLPYNEAIQITAWLSWVLNLLVAEWWIISRTKPNLRRMAA